MTTETRVTVNLPPASSGAQYLDLAAIYASANHRFISQQHVFTADFQVQSDAGVGLGTDAQFILNVLPTTWPMMGAYKYGRSMYDKAMKPESERKARWNDFRVKYDLSHNSQSTVYTADGCTYTSTEGEYGYSKVFSDDGAISYGFHMLGANDFAGVVQSFGLLQQYDDRDNTSRDDGTAQTDFDKILNDYNTSNESELVENGDLPPYNSQNLQLPAKQYNIHALGTAASPGYSHRRTGFVEVPMGLVKVTNNIEGSRTLTIVFKSGSNKGIQAVKI
jgi:hypothetical protein